MLQRCVLRIFSGTQKTTDTLSLTAGISLVTLVSAAVILTLCSGWVFCNNFTPGVTAASEHKCIVEDTRVEQYTASWGQNFCPIALVRLVDAQSDSSLHQATRYKGCRATFGSREEAHDWLGVVAPGSNSRISCYQFSDGSVKLDPEEPNAFSAVILFLVLCLFTCVVWVAALGGTLNLMKASVHDCRCVCVKDSAEVAHEAHDFCSGLSEDEPPGFRIDTGVADGNLDGFVRIHQMTHHRFKSQIEDTALRLPAATLSRPAVAYTDMEFLEQTE